MTRVEPLSARDTPLSTGVRLLSTEMWVHRLNALAAKIDEHAAVLHPSAWHEQLADLFTEYEALAYRLTVDDDELPAQLALPHL